MAEPVYPSIGQFRGTIAELRTVLEALIHLEQYLNAKVETVEDEDEQSAIIEDLEILHGIIPSFRHQFDEQYPGGVERP
jgi:hypothetical protein